MLIIYENLEADTNLTIEALKVLAAYLRGKAIDLHGYAQWRILGSTVQEATIDPVDGKKPVDRSQITFAEREQS